MKLFIAEYRLSEYQLYSENHVGVSLLLWVHTVKKNRTIFFHQQSRTPPRCERVHCVDDSFSSFERG